MKRVEYIQFIFVECPLRTDHWARPALFLEIYTTWRCLVSCSRFPCLTSFHSLIVLQGPTGLSRGWVEMREVENFLCHRCNTDGVSVLDGGYFCGL